MRNSAVVTGPERWYRWLLWAYPREYRAAHGEELIATLLEAGEGGRAVPQAREALALVAGGARARALGAGHGPAWADGVHLGVTVLAVLNLGVLVPYAGSVPVWTALAAVTLFAVMRGWVRVALGLVALVGGKVVAVVLGHPWLDQTLLPVFSDGVWNAPALYSRGGPVAPIAAYALAFLGLAALASRRGPLRRRTWRWWLAVPLTAGVDPASWLTVESGSPRAATRVGLELALLCLAVWAGRVAADPRWALAAALALLPAVIACLEGLAVQGAAYASFYGFSSGRQELSHLGMLVLLTVAAAAVPLHVRRHALL
ncbi:hypothetical protein DQ384_02950 [Sphaerisporangium album]|uniref:Uncharacterized protein n=1 Tax=Sphaerisporangium album TaxID=509200 RepID=A0A367FQ16_9ACTN|nr:hypothetical protein [Sphaerisporangium album]RCG32478.1 hypothetical protein DQ384_02950 [Sphaerisporangium album]